jgi:hypothetical protein
MMASIYDLSPSQISNALDYVHEHIEIEDAWGRDLDEQWAAEKAAEERDYDPLQQMLDQEREEAEANERNMQEAEENERVYREMREKEASWLQEYDEIVHDGYKVRDLRAAFQKVQDRDHWKNPISYGCDVDDIDILKVAVIFFTGSVPQFTHLHGRVWLCEADGYFRAIGA